MVEQGPGRPLALDRPNWNVVMSGQCVRRSCPHWHNSCVYTLLMNGAGCIFQRQKVMRAREVLSEAGKSQAPGAEGAKGEA